MWQIIDTDSEIVSYVYGTMHVQNNAAFSFIDEVKRHIDSKPIFYGETNLDDLATMQVNVDMYLLPDGKTLHHYISDKRYLKWRTRLLKHFNIDLNRLQHYIPFFILSSLQSGYLAADHNLPLDKHLWDYAVARGKMVKGIESADFQYEVMKDISLDDQFKMLKDFIAQPNKFKRRIETLEALYKSQDILQLYRSTRDSLGSQRRLLLTDRNVKMSQTILENRDQPSFYTFGAAHLAGDQGVLPLLKRGGMRIFPIKLS